MQVAWDLWDSLKLVNTSGILERLCYIRCISEMCTCAKMSPAPLPSSFGNARQVIKKS